ncbi:uncharacterized protein LOC119382269 [Rhipicephalus sanguineus]|uniref:uncharacterized protein LOC119382269 n=1 Tax=Rhipicephalus sanguineus TaxID=34632 RepID=UPI001894D78F|nr:uncharacterized protein LOC119382269 [Rhipicephalus sanguineus]
MVRAISEVWVHFTVGETVGGKRGPAVCKYCNSSYAFPNATRLSKHIAQCVKYPRQEVTPRSRSRSPSCSSLSSCENNGAVSSTASSAASATGRVTHFVDTMTLQAQKNADKALAKAIYASNSPFSLVTNDYWQAAFKALRSSYKPPSRHSLAGPLLDAEYEAATVSMNNSIEKASCITLVTDGWTNVEGESVINFVLCTPSPLFFKSVTTGTNRHTAAYMTEEICAVMESVGSSKVKALVTDNASNMKAAWALVIERFPHVTAIGCAAHSLNLLMNDLLTLGTIHDVHKQAKDIIKYVKQTHVVLATFKERQESKYGKNMSCSLKLPSKTRWSGVCLSFESLLKNK